MDKPEIDPKTGLWKDPQPYDFHIGAGNTAYENDGLDYEVDYMSSSACLLYTSPSPRDRG